MSEDRFHNISYYKRMSEIEGSMKTFMSSQFEHNKFFTFEIKEHSILLDAISMQLDEINKEVSSLESQFAQTQ